jgi:hypothetical protein
MSEVAISSALGLNRQCPNVFALYALIYFRLEYI